MTPSPLNLKKGNFVQHKSGVVGKIVSSANPYLFVQTKKGETVRLPYFPVDFVRLTKTEYDILF